MLDRWYDDGRFWHAHRGGGTFYCGLKLLDFDESRLVQATEADPYPPGVCPKCLHETAMRDVLPESLEHARGRGYQWIDPATEVV